MAKLPSNNQSGSPGFEAVVEMGNTQRDSIERVSLRAAQRQFDKGCLDWK